MAGDQSFCLTTINGCGRTESADRRQPTAAERAYRQFASLRQDDASLEAFTESESFTRASV